MGGGVDGRATTRDCPYGEEEDGSPHPRGHGSGDGRFANRPYEMTKGLMVYFHSN